MYSHYGEVCKYIYAGANGLGETITKRISQLDSHVFEEPFRDSCVSFLCHGHSAPLISG